MSQHSYRYLGPFMAIDLPMREVNSWITCCVNPSCSRRGMQVYASAFCSGCGNAMGKLESSRRQRVVIDHCAEFAERVTPAFRYSRDDGVQVYLPNDYDSLCPASLNERRESEGDGQRYHPLSGHEAGRETTWFLTSFAAQVERAKALVGEDRVHVQWGLVEYIT